MWAVFCCQLLLVRRLVNPPERKLERNVEVYRGEVGRVCDIRIRYKSAEYYAGENFLARRGQDLISVLLEASPSVAVQRLNKKKKKKCTQICKQLLVMLASRVSSTSIRHTIVFRTAGYRNGHENMSLDSMFIEITLTLGVVLEEYS